MTTIRAVLLDLDGTLLDTVLDLHAAADGMLAELSRSPVSVEDIRTYVGRGMVNLVKRLLAGQRNFADDPAPLQEIALESFRRHYALCNGRHARPFSGVMEGLGAFRAAGLPLGIVTNKPHAFTVPLLERTGLAEFITVTVSGDSLPRQKPDPMPLVWACGRLNVSPAETLMIGDSVHDCNAARAAGCPVFLVPYGYNEGQDVRTLNCDAIVAGIDDAARRVLSAHTPK
jgi:phosphoglycolate phosphatase